MSAAALAALAGACTYSVTDETGARRVIGLMMVEYAPAKDSKTFAGQVIDVTSLGVAWHSNPSGSSLGIGYTHETVGYLRDHALVLGNPYGARDYVAEAVAAIGGTTQ